MSLADIRYIDGAMNYEQRRRVEPEMNLARYMEAARRIVEEADGGLRAPELDLSADFEHLRWFPLPHEAASLRERSRDFTERPVGLP